MMKFNNNLSMLRLSDNNKIAELAQRVDVLLMRNKGQMTISDADERNKIALEIKQVTREKYEEEEKKKKQEEEEDSNFDYMNLLINTTKKYSNMRRGGGGGMTFKISQNKK